MMRRLPVVKGTTSPPPVSDAGSVSHWNTIWTKDVTYFEPRNVTIILLIQLVNTAWLR